MSPGRQEDPNLPSPSVLSSCLVPTEGVNEVLAADGVHGRDSRRGGGIVPGPSHGCRAAPEGHIGCGIRNLAGRGCQFLDLDPNGTLRIVGLERCERGAVPKRHPHLCRQEARRSIVTVRTRNKKVECDCTDKEHGGRVSLYRQEQEGGVSLYKQQWEGGVPLYRQEQESGV